MTDLQTAMREAVASAESQTPPARSARPTTSAPRRSPRTTVMQGSYLDYLRRSDAPAVAATLRVASETLTLAVLFVVATMIVAFGEDGGTVALPGLGGLSAPVAAVLATLGLRGLFLGLSRIDTASGARNR